MVSLLPVRLSNKQKKIFAFPYAGSGASFIHNYLATIPDDYDVYSIEYPGRNREMTSAELPTFSELCHEITYAIMQSVSHSDELFFIGISMGGYVAFKVAHLFETKLLKPAKSLQLYSVSSENFLKLSLNDQWPEKFLVTYNQGKLRALYEYIKSLMLIDGQILKTMSIGASYLRNTPIRIFNGSEDSYCHREDTKSYWQEKTNHNFFYQVISGSHIPKIIQGL